MWDLRPSKEDLDPIEVASRDEIAALQLKRLKWTLRHVYDNVPHYWKKFDEAGVHPDDLTIETVPARVAQRGDPWAPLDDAPQSLEPLLELHERDRANGLQDAPWPPVYPKMPGEPPRVAPSRARKPSND